MKLPVPPNQDMLKTESLVEFARKSTTVILRNHVKTIHGTPVGSLNCDHCGSDKFTTLKSLKEHIKGCEKNPNREVFYCLVERCASKDIPG